MKINFFTSWWCGDDKKMYRNVLLGSVVVCIASLSARVCRESVDVSKKQGWYSFEFFKFMTFHDFFHDLYKFSMTLGLAATLNNSQNFPFFRVFFALTQYNKQTLVSTKMRTICNVKSLVSMLHYPCFDICSD